MENIDQNQVEAFKRFTAEIRNKALAESYLAVAHLITQKEFAKRVKINESRFSRVLAKLESSKSSS